MIGPDVAPTPATQDPPRGSPTPSPQIQSDAAPASPKVPEPLGAQDLRLVIEEDKSAGSYVYKTVDPRTGKVIAQIPREELLKMRDAPDYVPGSVISSRG